MVELFESIISMGITASIIGISVVLLRKVFKKKVPSIVFYTLWMVFFIRLILPVTISSELSSFNFVEALFDKEVEVVSYLSDDVQFVNLSKINISMKQPIETLGNFVQGEPKETRFPAKLTGEILSIIWLSGFFILIVFTVIKYIKVIHSLKTATKYKSSIVKEVAFNLGLKKDVKIYETDQVVIPMVCGLFKPKVYLPLNIKEEKAVHVIAHELIHLKRKDYLVKLAVYFIACIHWFNPLVWWAVRLLSEDIEMSCDEKVINVYGRGIKQNYMYSMLSFQKINNKPLEKLFLTFGNNSLRKRIENLLIVKKDSVPFYCLYCAILIMFSITMLTNPIKVLGIDNPSPNVKVSDDIYVLNMVSPVIDGKITKGFNISSQAVYHDGIDISAREGDVIMAVEDGYVSYVGEDEKYGLLIKVTHKNGYETWYARCQSIKAEKDQKVKKSQEIGTVGFSGTGPHLHFSVLYNGEFIDPMTFLEASIVR